MSFPVYDYRTDVRNVLVTPHIRSRFMSMEPGQVAARHSHDLGHEIFLILEGKCEFTIDGETEILGPGQMCIALADQIHQVRVVGDEPMTMYLSVTPHIYPTHTGRNEDDSRKPIHFSNPGSYDTSPASDPIDDNIDRHVDAAQELARTAKKSASRQSELADGLKSALAQKDRGKAESIRNAMWAELYRVYCAVNKQGENWNDLAPHAVPEA